MRALPPDRGGYSRTPNDGDPLSSRHDSPGEMNPLDPLGLAGPAASLARSGLRTWAAGMSWSERQLLLALRARIAATAPPDHGEDDMETPAHASLEARMRDLLDRAVTQTTARGEQDLHASLLAQLVPDEARILAALSEGDAAPLVHVYAWSRAGLLGQPVLENASLVGRTAGLVLPHRTPLYVAHLRLLGLVAIGAELPELKTEYEVLLADDQVRAAIKEASLGPVTPRIARQSLRLSELGAELWRACGAAGSG